LRELKKEQNVMKQRMGSSYNNFNLLICTTDGKPINPRNFARTFHRLIEKAGIKKISIHGLRHTNATLLMRQGINPKIVSERLGHSSISITLDIYSHTDLDMQKETVAKLEKVLAS
jgi:site-specific recombinase XerD